MEEYMSAAAGGRQETGNFIWSGLMAHAFR